MRRFPIPNELGARTVISATGPCLSFSRKAGSFIDCGPLPHGIM